VFTWCRRTPTYSAHAARGSAGALDHPIRHIAGARIRVQSNTDDPTFHNVTPTLALAEMMARTFGFCLDDLCARFMLKRARCGVVRHPAQLGGANERRVRIFAEERAMTQTLCSHSRCACHCSPARRPGPRGSRSR